MKNMNKLAIILFYTGLLVNSNRGELNLFEQCLPAACFTNTKSKQKSLSHEKGHLPKPFRRASLRESYHEADKLKIYCYCSDFWDGTTGHNGRKKRRMSIFCMVHTLEWSGKKHRILIKVFPSVVEIHILTWSWLYEIPLILKPPPLNSFVTHSLPAAWRDETTSSSSSDFTNLSSVKCQSTTFCSSIIRESIIWFSRKANKSVCFKWNHAPGFACKLEYSKKFTHPVWYYHYLAHSLHRFGLLLPINENKTYIRF